MAVRWHTQPCSPSTIRFSLSGPHCDACGGSLDLEASRQEHANSPSFLPIPPDELGQLNLQWPPTVHYEGIDPAKTLQLVEAKTSEGLHEDVTGLPVYEGALTGGEIRLLYLSPSPLTEDPTHLH